MSTNKQPSASARHEKAVERKLAKSARKLAKKITRYRDVEQRSASIYRRSVKARVLIGCGKHCSSHQPCRSLGCLMCRYRAQIGYVLTYAPALEVAAKHGARRASNRGAR